MKCKEYQELILTAYLDDELNVEEKKRIEAHLQTCASCREFAAAARKNAIEPFNETEKFNPPEILWDKIREKIADEQNQPGDVPVPDPGGWWRVVFPGLKPVFAFGIASIVLVVLILSSQNPDTRQAQQVQHVPQTSQDKKEDTVEYIAYLFDQEERLQLDEYRGYGTAIEEYFL